VNAKKVAAVASLARALAKARGVTPASGDFWVSDFWVADFWVAGFWVEAP
jgi:hypothetical protein